MQKELYHSERYLGQEFSDELYHWKYLSRKRKMADGFIPIKIKIMQKLKVN